MKKIWILSIFAVAAMAIQQVEITADAFEADEMKMVTTFSGHVHMKRDTDELNASKIYVYFNKDKKPIRYEALGHASFVIHMKGKKIYKGKAGKLIYYPQKEIYELYKNVHLKEPGLDRTITGEKVTVEKQSGKANVEGNENKPVKFIFKVKDNNDSKNR